MTILLPHVAARAFNSMLMIEPGKAAAIMHGLGSRICDAGVHVSGAEPIEHVAFSGGERIGRLGDQLGRQYEQDGRGDRILRTVVDNVAVISIEGTLVHKGKWIGSSSGDTSYEGIQTQVMRAGRDRSIKGVVFEVDSFGGEAAGAFDTADMIAELSAVKPTIAIMTDFAFSGGYLLGAAARQMVLPEGGGVGSIGVVTMHVDFSKQLAQEGINVTILSSGARKAEGNPFEPLPADVAARIRLELDKGRDQFAEAVGRYRGTRLTKQAALATEAGSYRGQAAIDAGLADGIVRPSEAFETFVRAVNSRG
jgi:ClpP class serine protease